MSYILYKNKHLIGEFKTQYEAEEFALKDCRGANHVFHHYSNDVEFAQHIIIAIFVSTNQHTNTFMYEIKENK